MKKHTGVVVLVAAALVAPLSVLAADEAATVKKGEKAASKAEKPSARGVGEGRDKNWKTALQGSPSIEEATKKVDANPKSANAHNDLGWAYRQHDKLDEAEKELRKAIELEETLPQAHSNLSVVLLDKGNSTEAIKEGIRAVQIDDKQPIYHVVLGNALSAAGKYDDAIKAYNAAVDLNSDYENALYHLGRVYHLKGESSQATAVLDKALELDPNDTRVMELLDKVAK
jgi:Putative Zn-dependent protease, contains TPR repeats